MTGEVVQPTTIIRWRDEWQAGEYQRGEFVRDGIYASVANKETTDRPAPESEGPPVWMLP